MFKRIRNIFFTGILVLLPLIGSIYVIWVLLNIMDKVTGPMVETFFGRDLPGIGTIFTFVIIFLVGLFATNLIGRRIIHFGEKILMKIPFFRSIYISLKKVLEAMFSQHHDSFKKPVLFEYPRKDLYQIGFLTRKTSTYFDVVTGHELYNIFLPTTPNPTSGMFVLVPKEDTIILDISIEEALKLIISGGILSPEGIPVINNERVKGVNEER